MIVIQNLSIISEDITAMLPIISKSPQLLILSMTSYLKSIVYSNLYYFIIGFMLQMKLSWSKCCVKLENPFFLPE